MAKKSTLEEFYKRQTKDDKAFYKTATTKQKIDLISTGSWVINQLVGDGTGMDKSGGFPRGQVVEIMGDESSGKSTLGMSICRQVQMVGGIPVYLDYERSWNEWYAAKLGLDTNPNKMVLITPDYFEQGVRLLTDTLKFGLEPHVIVIDSVAAMTPKAFLEGSMEDAMRVGLHAQLMSRFLPLITKKIKETNTCLVLINQVRSLIKGKYDRGPNEESTGGKALRYYSSIRIKMETGQIEKIAAKSTITGKVDKKAVNAKVNVKVIKNKFDKPHKTGPVIIRFGDGFDNIMSMAELAIETGIIKKSGAFFSYSDGAKEIKVQGKEGLRDKLVEFPDLFDHMKEKTHVTVDASLKDIYLEDEAGSEAPEGDVDDMAKALEETSKNFLKIGKP